MNRECYSQALKWTEIIFASFDGGVDLESHEELYARWHVGTSYFRSRRQHSRAIQELDWTRDGFNMLDPGNEAALTLMHNMGIVYLDDGRYARGLRWLQRAHDGQTRLLNKNPKLVLSTRVDVKWSHALIGNQKQALNWTKDLCEDHTTSGPDQTVALMEHLLIILQSYSTLHPLDLARPAPTGEKPVFLSTIDGTFTMFTRNYLISLDRRSDPVSRASRYRRRVHVMSRVQIHPGLLRKRRGELMADVCALTNRVIVLYSERGFPNCFDSDGNSDIQEAAGNWEGQDNEDHEEDANEDTESDEFEDDDGEDSEDSEDDDDSEDYDDSDDYEDSEDYEDYEDHGEDEAESSHHTGQNSSNPHKL